MKSKIYNGARRRLSYVECGGGPALHLFHANGFSAGVYEPIINRLKKEHTVYGLNYCSHGLCDCGPDRIRDWYVIADDFIDYLDNRVQRPVVAVGHSFGGVVSLMTAVRRPELVRALILLDPVLLEPRIIRLIRVAVLMGKRSEFPLAKKARRRRNGWANRDEAMTYLESRPLFEGWSTSSLDAYIKHGMIEDENGELRLACPPEIEAQGFETYPADIWKWVSRLKTPTVIIRGEKSDVLTEASWRKFGRVQPDIERITLPGCGHLFPMQRPDMTAELILKHARDLSPDNIAHS